MVNLLPTFGELLKSAREKAGLSQAELSELCGISQANISRYEANKREPLWSAVQKIATALGIDPSALADQTKRARK